MAEAAVQLAFVLGGIALLAGGGELLIRGALAIANRLRISPLLSGLIIVGFGTSMPELSVSVGAAQAGNADIAIGNVVGSNIGNILLILGLCAMISPLKVSAAALRRDAGVMIGASALLVGVALIGALSWPAGIGFLLLLGAYLGWTYVSDRQHGAAAEVHEQEAEAIHAKPKSTLLAGLLLVVGLVMLIAGAQLLIRGAEGLATGLGVSAAAIGLTVVAVGTSLPELTVSVMAAIRKQGDVAIGNILGSNIFNILGILGISALVQPLAITGRVAAFDQWVMLATAVVLFGLLATGKRLGRVEGVLLLAGYIGYVIASFVWL